MQVSAPERTRFVLGAQFVQVCTQQHKKVK